MNSPHFVCLALCTLFALVLGKEDRILGARLKAVQLAQGPECPDQYFDPLAFASVVGIASQSFLARILAPKRSIDRAHEFNEHNS